MHNQNNKIYFNKNLTTEPVYWSIWNGEKYVVIIDKSKKITKREESKS